MAARLILAVLAWLPLAAAAFDHQSSDGLLRRHVALLPGGNASQLGYAGMARERMALRAYLESLSRVSQSEFAGWPVPERMAFLLNAYNAFTVEKVLTRYPDIGSIWDFGKVFSNPFKDEFFELLGARRNLDWIEHEKLRKDYREPRIHFAVNCASVGCPMLREEAYAAARLDAQLEEQARRFLSDRSRNRLREGALEVSKIFDWFRQDFEPRAAYFARYAGLLSDHPEERAAIAAGKAPLRYLDYDWSLNDARP